MRDGHGLVVMILLLRLGDVECGIEIGPVAD